MCEYFVKADPIQYEQRTRTIRIHGVLTSIRLENMVWDTLAEMAAAEDRTTNSLIVQLHDEIVAHISHLPQVVASALCAFLATRNPAWRNHAGGGLRDTTRIAGSDPHLWRTILEQNRDEVLRALDGFESELHALRVALANRDFTEITARMERGKAYRDLFRPRP